MTKTNPEFIPPLRVPSLTAVLRDYAKKERVDNVVAPIISRKEKQKKRVDCALTWYAKVSM